MGSVVEVRRATETDRDALVEEFGRCSDEVVTAWITQGYPIEALREEHVPAIIDRGLSEDEVWIATAEEEIWAISIWQHVTSVDRFVAEAEQMRTMWEQSPELSVARRLSALTALVAQKHPQEFPHGYLKIIVTVPEHRGKGAGAAILSHRMAEYAASGLPVYLEASTERSSRLYARFGFQQHGPIMHLPEDGPTLIPMWFQP